MTHVTIDKPVLGQYNVMNYNKSPKEKVASQDHTTCHLSSLQQGVRVGKLVPP